ncbi:MAG: PQQ-binding-like beta-propeller repeat protein [Chloroflexota bacterium]
MERNRPCLVGPLLLMLLYLLVQFAYPALGDGSLGLDKYRAVLTLWLFVAVGVTGVAYAGLNSQARFGLGAVTGLLATLLIPVWIGHGCWSPDMMSGILIGFGTVVGGGLAAHLSPILLDRLAALRPRLTTIAGITLIVAFALTSALTLPPLPRPRLTISGGSGPTLSFRRAEPDSFLSELSPKPWARARIYYGTIGIGADSVVQVIADRGVRQVGLAGATLPPPETPAPNSQYASWYQPLVAGNLALLRWTTQQWPSVIALPSGRLLPVADDPRDQLRTAVLTDSGAYLAGWESVRALDRDGAERWLYRRQPATASDLKFRNEGTLAITPASYSSPGQGNSCFVTADGVVVDLIAEIAALANDGSLRWRRPTAGRFLALLVPAGEGPALALEMRPTGTDPTVATGFLMALDRATGRLLWEWQVPDDVVALDWASDGQSLLLVLDRRSGEALTRELQLLSRDGDPVWTVALNRDELLTNRLLPTAGGYLLVGSWQALMIDPADGSTRWAVTPDQSGASRRSFDYANGVALWHDAVLLTTGRQLTAYDVVNGDRLWEYVEPYGITGLAVSGDRLAVGHSRGLALLYWPDPCPP